MVSNIFYFHPYLGIWSNLTNVVQIGWFNHQRTMIKINTSKHGISKWCTEWWFSSLKETIPQLPGVLYMTQYTWGQKPILSWAFLEFVWPTNPPETLGMNFVKKNSTQPLALAFLVGNVKLLIWEQKTDLWLYIWEILKSFTYYPLH